jgi:tRNA(Ile)-lysidine synthase
LRGELGSGREYGAMKPARFFRRLRAYVDEQGLLEAGQQVVVGVSGGPDSMALLHGLVAVDRMDERGWGLHVAHLNHGLRGPEAEADAAFVAEQARRLSLPVFVERVDVRASAERSGRTLEEEARYHRYAFFERLCLKTESTCVAVGHHADDNAETVLHRILRGSGVRGLAGIAPVRPLRAGSEVRLIRPLLGFREEELGQFLLAAGIESREDVTNALPDYTRNRLRQELLPMIRRDFNVRITEALLRLAQQAAWIDTYLRETAERTLQSLVVSQTDRQLVINVPGLRRKGRIIQTELIRQGLLRFGIREQDLSFAHLVAVVRQCAQPTSGKTIQLPSGLVARREYDRLILAIQPEQAGRPISPTGVAVPGRTVVGSAGVAVQAEVVAFDFAQLPGITAGKSRSEEWLDYDRVALPLVLRSRQRGDRFWPLGAGGSKRLAEFFIDEKIEPSRRSAVPILCDQRGPVWVVPIRIDDRVKLRSESKRALRLTVHPLDK